MNRKSIKNSLLFFNRNMKLTYGMKSKSKDIYLNIKISNNTNNIKSNKNNKSNNKKSKNGIKIVNMYRLR
jgi:hypothetical protein